MASTLKFENVAPPISGSLAKMPSMAKTAVVPRWPFTANCWVKFEEPLVSLCVPPASRRSWLKSRLLRGRPATSLLESRSPRCPAGPWPRLWGLPWGSRSAAPTRCRANRPSDDTSNSTRLPHLLVPGPVHRRLSAVSATPPIPRKSPGEDQRKQTLLGVHRTLANAGFPWPVARLLYRPGPFPRRCAECREAKPLGAPRAAPPSARNRPTTNLRTVTLIAKRLDCKPTSSYLSLRVTLTSPRFARTAKWYTG